MFLHVFTNMFKCLVRDKQNIFWLMIFPILLGTMFKLAIPDASVSTNFSSIDIAVIETNEYQNDEGFKSVISSVTMKDSDSKDEPMFNAVFVDEEEAKILLEKSSIKGYILFDGKPHVIVKESGISQTILKEFVSNYLQYENQFKNILSENPYVMNDLLNQTADRKEYIKEVSASSKTPNNSLTYYYALITMTCLYGGVLGLRVVIELQANQSTKGARVNVAPVNKLKLFTYSIFAAILVQILVVTVLLLYLNFVLNISFGEQIIYIIITTIVSAAAGVSFGGVIAAIVKGTKTVKLSVLLSFSMIMSFFSGLMWPDIKYIMTSKFPPFAYINFGNLIADTFYSLYYYDIYTRFFINIVALFGISILFNIIIFFVMRRQKYESI